MRTEPVVIIGAGVISLSTAYTILSQRPGTQLLIIAAELPTDDPSSWTPDYASMWAGAHYRPIAPSTHQEQKEQQLAIKTCSVMRKLAKKSPEAGISVLPAIEYLETPRQAELQLRTGDLYASRDDDFRVLDAKELPPKVAWSCQYNTYCINVPVYCTWLLNQIVKKGGRILKRTLNNPQEAFSVARDLGLDKVKTVINCSGRGFDKDPKVYPVRGQTVLVRQQYHKTITRQCSDGTWSFLIPRPNAGGTIIGGTKEPGNWDGKPGQETREELLRRAAEFFPDFVDDPAKFEVLRDNVGRRPAREGGFRAEVEMMRDGRRIIHGYGAGGRGYELSWGLAEKLAGLFERTRSPRASL